MIHQATSVEVKALTKRYSRRVVAVSEVSFQARAGEIFGLLGPNGAGKTTTLRMLATLLTPTDGTALINGHDIRRAPAAVRRDIGVVSGGMGLYDHLTGREVLEYFAGFYGLGKADTARRIAGLAQQLQMDELLDRRTRHYSTGMKQKIVIARAVIHDPSVVILDEATNGLDIVARRAVLDFAQAFRQAGKTVLYSTHILGEAEELCDRAVILHEGRIKAEGTIVCLKARVNAATLEQAYFDLVRGPRASLFGS
nr:ATP-binding cassette domain-containing protein [Deinococcus aestuarii]